MSYGHMSQYAGFIPYMKDMANGLKTCLHVFVVLDVCCLLDHRVVCSAIGKYGKAVVSLKSLIQQDAKPQSLRHGFGKKPHLNY